MAFHKHSPKERAAMKRQMRKMMRAEKKPTKPARKRIT